jgi:hypothetical protein
VQTFAAVGIKLQAQDPLVLSHAQELYTKFQYLYPGASREFLELRILGALQRQLNDGKNPRNSALSLSRSAGKLSGCCQ